MLVLDNIDSFYGRSHVLHDLSVVFQNGDLTAVLGRNGTGKTTLLKTIMGLTDRATGKIALDGVPIGDAPAFRRARAGIAYVPQGREIIADFTVRENILMGGFASAGGGRTVPPLVAQMFPELMQRLDRAGGFLSGGQQQQLAIARALAARPKVLLLDEPTEGIQPNLVEEIRNVFIRLNRAHGVAVVLVEQDVAFARRASQRFVILEKGRIAAGGMVEELTDDLIHRHMAV